MPQTRMTLILKVFTPVKGSIIQSRMKQMKMFKVSGFSKVYSNFKIPKFEIKNRFPIWFSLLFFDFFQTFASFEQPFQTRRLRRVTNLWHNLTRRCASASLADALARTASTCQTQRLLDNLSKTELVTAKYSQKASCFRHLLWTVNGFFFFGFILTCFSPSFAWAIGYSLHACWIPRSMRLIRTTLEELRQVPQLGRNDLQLLHGTMWNPKSWDWDWDSLWLTVTHWNVWLGVGPQSLKDDPSLVSTLWPFPAAQHQIAPIPAKHRQVDDDFHWRGLRLCWKKHVLSKLPKSAFPFQNLMNSMTTAVCAVISAGTPHRWQLNAAVFGTYPRALTRKIGRNPSQSESG